MTLLAGSALDPKRFFRGGNPQVQGSSFDLTIGCIFDHQGKKVEGHFTIKPGHMVQVVSSEELMLSDRLTGHVTYKTTMTRQGIWALTVGIVDPGWQGPIATTLLNFSSVGHCVAEGDPFLRVSLFEHEAVPPEKLRKAPPLDVYLKDIQKIAASRFPPTFLDTTEIADAAGKNVLTRIRIEALGWVAGIALVFTVLQVIVNLFTGSRASVTDLEALKTKIEIMQAGLLRIEAAKSGAPPVGAPAAAAPPVTTSGSVPPAASAPPAPGLPPATAPASPGSGVPAPLASGSTASPSATPNSPQR